MNARSVLEQEWSGLKEHGMTDVLTWKWNVNGKTVLEQEWSSLKDHRTIDVGIDLQKRMLMPVLEIELKVLEQW